MKLLAQNINYLQANRKLTQKEVKIFRANRQWYKRRYK